MHREMKYEAYTIYFDGAVYAAETTQSDGDENADEGGEGSDLLRIYAKDLKTVIKALDELYQPSNTGPSWLRPWFMNPTYQIDLDALYVMGDPIVIHKPL